MSARPKIIWLILTTLELLLVLLVLLFTTKTVSVILLIDLLSWFMEGRLKM